MTKMYEKMRKGKKISVFLGSLRDELALDEYLRLEFSQDFGFEINPNDGPEAQAGAPTNIESLLDGFSRINTFKDEVVKLAKDKGINEAACAIIFYNFVYDPKLVNPSKSNKVEFLGVVDYSGFI